MFVVVAVYVLRELVSRPIVTAHLGHERNRILRSSYTRVAYRMATLSSQNSVAGCRAVDFVHRFDLPSYTQFAAVDPVCRRRHRRSAASPIYAFLSGSVDCHWVIP